MKKIILLITLALPFTASAAEDYCHLISDTPEKIVNVKHEPQWFAKVKNTGDWIFYITHEGNHLLSTTDTNDMTRDVRIWGSYDPVPSPDGRVLTVPGMVFYNVEDILRDKADAKPLWTDNDLGGVYQSVALLKIVEPDVRHYRVITDGQGTEVQYRDYEVDFRQTPATVKPITPVTMHCPGRALSTIMVSKTGRYMTAYDTRSATTKVYDMVDMGPKRCRELLDLGYGTGKIEWNIGTPRHGELFNFDDSDERMTFHIDYFGSNIGTYFSTVKTNQVKDIFTMDVEPFPANRQGDWRLKPVSLRKLFSESRLGSGGYYPSFMSDGKVAVVFDDADSFSFRIFDTERSKPYEFYLPPPAQTFVEAWENPQLSPLMPQNWQARFHRAAAIGALWSQTCLAEQDQRADTTGVGSTSYFLGLSKESCTELVNAKWESTKNQVVNHSMWQHDPRFSTQMIQAMTTNDLLQACAKIQEHPQANPPIVIGEGSAQHLTKDKLIHSYCMGCHVPDSRLVSLTGENYPNTVTFERWPDGTPKTTLSHLLASKRRVQAGIDAVNNGADRPPDAMPPSHPFEDPSHTEFDHGAEVQSIINRDIQASLQMPKRIPLWLREEAQNVMAEAALQRQNEGGVFFRVNGNVVSHFSMPQTQLGQEQTLMVELVNNSGSDITELGAVALNSRGFFFPGSLFPGRNGDCGSELRKHTSCKIEIGFSPSSRRQLFSSSLTVSYTVVNGPRREERTVTLALDGIAAALASR